VYDSYTSIQQWSIMDVLVLLESACSELKTDLNVPRIDGDCFVAYPQGSNGVKRTWYQARNKCLLLNGDLAIISITRAADLVNMLETDEKYWIGLQRDPLQMPLPGTFNHLILQLST